AAFFARERLGRAALPVGAAECRVLGRVPPGAELTCVAVLEEASGGALAGHSDLCDGAGRPLVQLRGLDARVVELAAPADRAGDGGAKAGGDAGGGGRGHGHAGESGHAGDRGHRDGNGHGHGNGHGSHVPDPATYRIEQFPELVELSQRRAMVSAVGLRNPYFHLHERVTNERSIIGGTEFINYSSYNYLRLSGHPEVNRAAQEAIDRYGTSVSASRVASGEQPLHRELERALADLLGCEDAIVLVSGHATNVSVIGHLVDHRDVILHDS